MSKWEMVRLGDYIKQIRGVSYKPEDVSENEDGNHVPVLRAHNIQTDGLNFKNLVYVNKQRIQQIQFIRRNDIVVCASSGSKELVGKAAQSSEDMMLSFGAFCKVVRPQKGVNPRYLRQYFNSTNYRRIISDLSSGANISNLRNEHIDELILPLPPLPIQQKIADVLDKASALIEMRKAQIEKLDLLIKSQFIEMFGDPVTNPKGWEKEVLQDHADILSGYPFNSDNFSDKGIKICGGLIIMPNRILWDECKYLESSKGYEGYLLNENDILMAMDRPWISEGFKIAKMERDSLPALLIQRTARIRGIDIDQEYLYIYLIIGGFDRHCNVTGSLVPHISIKDIRSFKIMIPPLILQEEFAVIAKQIMKRKLQLQQSFESLSINYQTLLQKFFSGEMF